MSKYTDLFYEAESPKPHTSEEDGIKVRPIDEIVYQNRLLEIRSGMVLRLYDTSKSRDSLEQQLKIGFMQQIQELNLQDMLVVYTCLRDSAMLYKMTGNVHQWDRHLEAADFLRKEFGLKILSVNDLANRL